MCQVLILKFLLFVKTNKLLNTNNQILKKEKQTVHSGNNPKLCRFRLNLNLFKFQIKKKKLPKSIKTCPVQHTFCLVNIMQIKLSQQ